MKVFIDDFITLLKDFEVSRLSFPEFYLQRIEKILGEMERRQ